MTRTRQQIVDDVEQLRQYLSKMVTDLIQLTDDEMIRHEAIFRVVCDNVESMLLDSLKGKRC